MTVVFVFLRLCVSIFAYYGNVGNDCVGRSVLGVGGVRLRLSLFVRRVFCLRASCCLLRRGCSLTASGRVG